MDIGLSPALSAQQVADIGSWLDGLAMNRRHWLVFAVCSLAFLFDGFDFQAIALVLPSVAQEWALSSHQKAQILMATGLGMLAGTSVFGWLADRIGRRTGFMLTIGIFAVFSGLCAVAQTPWQLMALRFCAGVGMGGFMPVDTAVMTEFVPAGRRGRLMAWWAIFFSLGLLLATAVGKWVIPAEGWRTMFLLCAVPAVMVLAVRLLIPETPRFLLAHHRLEEARESVHWVSNGRTCPTLEAAIEIGSVPSRPPRVPLSELFSAAYGRRTAVAWIAWFSWSFAYFGLLLWMLTLLVQYRHIPAPEAFSIVIGYTAAGIVGRAVASTVVDRIGRLPLIVGCSFVSAALMVVFGWQESATGLMVSAFALALFFDAGLGTVATYTPELFPTRMRATSTGAALGVGRVATLLAPLAVGYLVDWNLHAVFAMFAGMLVLGGAAVWALGKETRGQTLEQSSGELIA